jgi:parallel beta-helix repeat protein
VIVRNNRAESNVAGIEIENTIGADVYGNGHRQHRRHSRLQHAEPVAAGPFLARVQNKVFKNNLGNFAAKGAAVASVPAGAGVVVNSNSKVEIFDNDIADNQTANTIISAYFSTNYYNKPGIDPNYDPYPRAIYIYGNRFSGGGDSPDGLDLKTLKVALFGSAAISRRALGWLPRRQESRRWQAAGRRTPVRAERRSAGTQRRWPAQVRQSEGHGPRRTAMRSAEAAGDRDSGQDLTS